MSQPTFGRIVRNNLLALLAAAVLMALAAKLINQPAAFIFALVYLGQALFNLFMAFAHLGSKPGEVGAAPYFLSTLLVLIIGFGACSGIFMLGGGLGDMH